MSIPCETGVSGDQRVASQQRRHRPPWHFALAIVFAALCVIGAGVFRSYQVADGNTADLVEIARACNETDQCLAGGAGRLGVFNGAAWVRLVAYSLRNGADLTQAQSVVFGLLLLSAAVTFGVTTHYIGLRAAMFALGLYLPAVLSAGDFATFENPNLFPLPAALYYAGVLLFTAYRATIFSVVASLALAVGATGSIVLLVLVPFHVGLVALWARRPMSAVAVSCLSIVVVLFSTGVIGAAQALAERLLDLPVVFGLVIGGIVVVAALRMIRRADVLVSMTAPQRIRAVMIAALIYSAAIIWLACGIFGLPLPPESRYLQSAVFPLLFLAAAATETLGPRGCIVFVVLELAAAILLTLAPQAPLVGRTPLIIIVTLCALGLAALSIIRRDVAPALRSPALAVIVLGFTLGVTLPDLVRGRCSGCVGFALAQGERIVSSFYLAGYTFPQLFRSLHGPGTDTLLSQLAAHDPNLFGAPAYLPDEGFSLQLLKVPRAAVPREIVVASDLDGSQTAIVIRGEPSFLDWVHAEVCRLPPAKNRAAPDCIKLLAEARLLHVGSYLPVVNTAAPSVDDRPNGEAHFARPMWRWPAAAGGARPDDEGASSLHVAMPIHTPGRGATHIIRGRGDTPDERWRILLVTGVEFEGAVPGGEIRVLDRHASDGIVEFEVASVGDEPPWNWLRHLIEVTEDNAYLLQRE